eukprot:c4238_g1_i1.p2 GENE.c4238_g1_i1~~c4238_g1_i1.p2  ORF type:complete len:109 (-),score=22.47 c4238_g1_i1:618-944(-)
MFSHCSFMLRSTAKETKPKAAKAEKVKAESKPKKSAEEDAKKSGITPGFKLFCNLNKMDLDPNLGTKEKKRALINLWKAASKNKKQVKQTLFRAICLFSMSNKLRVLP